MNIVTARASRNGKEKTFAPIESKRVEWVKGRKWHKKPKTYSEINRFLSTDPKGNGIDSNSIEIHLIVLLCFSCLRISTSASVDAMCKRWRNVSDACIIKRRQDHLLASVTLTLSSRLDEETRSNWQPFKQFPSRHHYSKLERCLVRTKIYA